MEEKEEPPRLCRWATVGDLGSIKYILQKEGPDAIHVTDTKGRTGTQSNLFKR